MRVKLQCEGNTENTDNVVDADGRPVISLSKGTDVEQPWYSDPITVAQAKKLVSFLDTWNVELLRQITLGGGSITWPQMQKVCCIRGTNFDQYHNQHCGKIDHVLQVITKGEHRYLITYEDGAPAWDTDDWKDVKLEIDGPALTSLKEVFAV